MMYRSMILTTRTEQIAIAVDIVNSAYGRPVLVFLGPRRGKSRRFSTIAAPPGLSRQILGGVRRSLQRVILFVRLSGLNSTDLAEDRYHCVAESIQLSSGFALRGLDHECTGNRPGHGGGMESVVHQAFSDIFHFDPGRFFKLPQVNDAFVSDSP